MRTPRGRRQSRSMPEVRMYPAWVIVHPSEVKGQWVSHCLDFDVVSQGNSIEHAFKMSMEATLMVLGDDAQTGRDPHSRRAPQRFWTALSEMLPYIRPVTPQVIRAREKAIRASRAKAPSQRAPQDLAFLFYMVLWVKAPRAKKSSKTKNAEATPQVPTVTIETPMQWEAPFPSHAA